MCYQESKQSANAIVSRHT